MKLDLTLYKHFIFFSLDGIILYYSIQTKHYAREMFLQNWVTPTGIVLHLSR